MSLVGSLEDLNLGDILQIISLSQKSGVLVLRTSDGGGRIVFVGGLVRGAAVKGGPQDLRGVLVAGGFIDEPGFEAAHRRALSEGLGLEEAVARTTPISSERIQSLCREAVEAAVVTMFSWQRGEFSFDVRTELETDDPELLLPTGINAQYLAMEGARLRDEADKRPEPGRSAAREIEAVPAAGSAARVEPPESFAGLAEAAGEEEPATPQARGRAEAIDRLAQATLERLPAAAADLDAVSDLDAVAVPSLDAVVEVSWESEESALETGLLEAEALELDEELADGGVAALAVAPAATPAVVPAVAGPGLSRRPLVVIDDELPALEWVKQTLQRDFARIHIFQRSELGLARLRQYLVRGEIPLLLISPRAAVDTLSGIRGTRDFVRRLKAQSSRITVLWLCEQGVDAGGVAGPGDGSITRPESRNLRPGKPGDKQTSLADGFRTDLRAALSRLETGANAASRPPGAQLAQPVDLPPDELRRLRDATRQLSDAASKGEVLPLVMRFAAESFSRVAMFMVRDGTAVGMAQSGLPLCGGPDEAGLRSISVDTSDCRGLSRVLAERRPVCGAPTEAGDLQLAGLLGNRVPETCYLAPIESGGQVIAVLYGDNLPSGLAVGDTSGLEVVLHHAGLALDRAALERALQENGADEA